ncbi:MAG: tryptophan--tRNA ligase [Candidatus Epulonipiscioides saccharophilum]|nr:MAG: tryptophan--tRNA ligase [Epulopiscium sp. AS2M-Bin001]
MMETKKTIFSGMQPTGAITLGNYLGALKNWTSLQDEYNCLYCIVDMHAITVRQNPAELRKNARNLLIQYIAAGLDPAQNIIYYQSHVSGHAELAWILNCFTYMGELNRMTQFKDKSSKHSENINAGLYTYPALMAADILLYNTDLVPIGNDQKQHLELTRDIAERFNTIYGETFTIPEGYIGKVGARIMDLQEPTKKMSKSSEDKNATILLTDKPEEILKKFKRAVTDNVATIKYDPENQPGISNLISIYSAITGKSYVEIENEFSGSGYGNFKIKVAESVIEILRPIQQKYDELQKDKSYIDHIIKDNAQKANYQSQKILRKVQKKIGFPSIIR